MLVGCRLYLPSYPHVNPYLLGCHGLSSTPCNKKISLLQLSSLQCSPFVAKDSIILYIHIHIHTHRYIYILETCINYESYFLLESLFWSPRPAFSTGAFTLGSSNAESPANLNGSARNGRPWKNWGSFTANKVEKCGNMYGKVTFPCQKSWISPARIGISRETIKLWPTNLSVHKLIQCMVLINQHKSNHCRFSPDPCMCGANAP